MTLLRRARLAGAPLIEGERATFVWFGREAPRLIGDFTHWEEKPQRLRRVGDGVWARTIDFYRDAYVEYAFLGARGRVRDPHNANRRSNRVKDANNFFYMPAARPTALATRRPDVPRGTITRHRLEVDPYAVTETRPVDLYAPAARGPWPLLVILDGNDYLRRARLATIVDNLIADRRIRPVAMALLHHARAARVVEYAGNDATLAILLDRLVPFARERLDLVDAPGAHAILGASMGGLMALYAGVRAPDTFGRVLSQSGAFQLVGRDSVVFKLAAARSRRLLRVWLDVGHLERLRAANVRMRRALVARGDAVTYREYHAGHNWTAWRDDVWRGLEALFSF